MIESLITGYRYMMYSTQVSMGDEYDAEEEESAFEMGGRSSGQEGRRTS